jgi:hypothetical protein
MIEKGYDTNWKPVVKKATYSAAIGTAAAYFLLGENTGELEGVAGMMVPTSVGVGLSCAGGSIAGDLLSGFVIERLDQSSGIRTAESELTKLGVSGLSTVAVLKGVYGVDPSLNGFLLGGASKFAADGIYLEVDDSLLGMLF